jgi:quaternary ammonium compound-resistance protein SugE
MHWTMLVIAVIANACTNIAFKYAVISPSLQAEDAKWNTLLFNPWLWAGGVSGLILLGSYLVAIRTIDLGIAYAAVTSLALVLLTAASALLFGEQLDVRKLIGIALVISGITLLTVKTTMTS